MAAASPVVSGRISKRKAYSYRSPTSSQPRSIPKLQLISLASLLASEVHLTNDRALGDAQCPPLPSIRPPSPLKTFVPIRHSEIKRVIAEEVPAVSVGKPRLKRNMPTAPSMKVTRSASAALPKSPPQTNGTTGEPTSARKRRPPEISLSGAEPPTSGRMKRAASTQAMENIQANQSGASDSEDPPAKRPRRVVTAAPIKRAASLGPTSPLAKGFGSDSLPVPSAHLNGRLAAGNNAASRSRSRLASPLSAAGTEEEQSDEMISPTDGSDGAKKRPGRAREGPAHLKDYF